jgi:hypothetical protein
MNFAAGRIINLRTDHNSLCVGKNKHLVTNYVMGYKAMAMGRYKAYMSSPLLLHID